MTFAVGVMLLAAVTAIACALPGVFIVLRKNSMLIDAMSHAVLPGIVVGYFFTNNLRSPLLVLAAALAGLLVVLSSEWLTNTGLIAGDAPQGLVFPALFSIGVILISQNFAGVHLDTHAVLAGDLNIAALAQLTIAGVAIGPQYLYLMLGVCALNTIFLAACGHHLALATFDREFASSIGIRVRTLNLTLMFLVSVTVTAAFAVAGAILVIALVVIPAATALLISSRLPMMFAMTTLVAIGGALGGFWSAYWLNAPTSATMSVFYGLIFAAVFFTVRIRRYSRSRRNSHGPNPSRSHHQPRVARI